VIHRPPPIALESLFDEQRWHERFTRIPLLRAYGQNFSILGFMALENERVIPQQSVSTITNLDDVESYIRYCESQTGDKYLTIIDLPATERADVMRELRMMGITAGSLFPGLDGACEELRERYFPG
jgi:hypothetical protein